MKSRFCAMKDHRRARMIWFCTAGLVAATIAPVTTRATDKWINPAGGDWTVGSNWSNGVPPVPYETAQFLLGSPGGYNISNGAVSGGELPVQNDQAQFTGMTTVGNDMVPVIRETSTAGQRQRRRR